MGERRGTGGPRPLRLEGGGEGGERGTGRCPRPARGPGTAARTDESGRMIREAGWMRWSWRGGARGRPLGEGSVERGRGRERGWGEGATGAEGG